jgi:hypothetical protein
MLNVSEYAETLLIRIKGLLSNARMKPIIGELQRLTILKKNHVDDVFLARRKVKTLPETIARSSELFSQLTSQNDCYRSFCCTSP